MRTESTCIHYSLAQNIIMLLVVCVSGAIHSESAYGVPSRIEFAKSSDTADAYDFVEITLKVEKPDAGNPFTDVVVEGSFTRDGGREVRVDGFCDSSDVSTFRVRFMPTQPGDY